MKKLTKLSLSNILLIITLLGLSFFTGKGVFKYNVFSTHDGDHHVARSFDAIQTIKEGHFPLRWAGSLNFNCGVAIYNFFYPLLYYLVIAINFLVKDVIGSLKIIYFLTLPAGTLFFYWWLKIETKNKWAALGGAVLYLFAPYRFLLIFVRGSPEFLSYALLPVVLYLFSLSFEQISWRKFVWIVFGSSLAGGLLVVSHNFTVMFLMPILLFYLIIKIIRVNKLSFSRKRLILFSYFSAFGLGAFFIFPALLEKQFVQIGQVIVINFREHFPTLKQLIRSPWDYFYSSPGVKNDGMSFQLGYAHWLIMGGVSLFSLKKIFKSLDPLILFFLIISLGSVFLILSWSLFIWERVSLLQQIQFSWRLLGIAVFSISALFAFWLESLKKNIIFFPILAVGIFLAIFGNRHHLLPQPVSTQTIYQYDDFEKLHPHRHSTTTLGDDILGVGAKESCSFDTPLLLVGGKFITDYQVQARGNTFGEIRFFLGSQEEWKEKPIILGLEYFPGIYHFQINGSDKVNYSDCEGRVCLDSQNFRQGANYLSWKIGQSPIERVFNGVSIAFFIAWIIIIVSQILPEKYKIFIKMNKLKIFLFGLLLLIFAFFRFYRLPERIVFNWDQERDAQVVKEMINFKKFTLIGPRVLGPEGFFLAPYFYYFLLPFYYVFNLFPQGLTFFIVAVNLAFFGISFLILTKIFNIRISFYFLALWSIIPWAVGADIIAWNPLLIPLLVLLFLLAFDQFFLKKQLKTIFFLGLVFSIGINFHVQFFLLLPFIFLVLFSLWKEEKKILLGWSAWLIAGIGLPFLPLLIFDLRHNFLNISLLKNFLFQRGRGQPLAFLPVWNRVVNQLLGLEINNIGGLVFYLIILALFLAAYKKAREKKNLWLGMLLTWILMPVFFGLYGSRPSEYYFNYLQPLLIILISFWLDKILLTLKKKQHWLFATFIALFILVYYCFKNIPLLADNRQGLFYKTQTAKFLTGVSDSGPLNISFSGSWSADNGFHYLFDIYQVKQSQNPEDPLIEVVVPAGSRPSTIIFGAIGVYFPEGWLSDYWIL
ncbi:MAG: hypothetical protein ABIB61_02135 [Candidatus Shapirobacteria bacterium]